eukprot:TRINITY_DN12404_c4_g1_i11.p2 TRINITY_DN12404_c4_g1~~TRINITY_DN12404_c4_g1_i11.p2  ORF type:complete len:104 (+),score=16.85 TRINITY_DN12404_c4_g1_i11:325-636(+)
MEHVAATNIRSPVCEIKAKLMYACTQACSSLPFVTMSAKREQGRASLGMVNIQIYIIRTTIASAWQALTLQALDAFQTMHACTYLAPDGCLHAERHRSPQTQR